MATATHASPMGLDQLNTTLYVFSGTGAGFNTIQAAVDFARVHTGGMGEIVVVYGHPDGESIGGIIGGTATILILDERHGADQRWTWNGANYVPQTFTQLGDVTSKKKIRAYGFSPTDRTASNVMLGVGGDGTTPTFSLINASAPADQKNWLFAANTNQLYFSATADNEQDNSFLIVTRSGAAATSIDIYAPLNVHGTLAAVDAKFDTCEVDSSPVRTFANTPDSSMIYPGAGIGVSTGSAWAASIDPATLQAKLTLTTTGSSGPATLTGATLNIPQYSGGAGMIFPAAGIGVSTGSAWGASIDPATIPRLGADNTFTGRNIFIVPGVDGVTIIAPSGSGGNAGFGMGPDGGDAWFLLATGTSTTPNQWVLYNPTSGKTPLVVNDHGGISFIEGRAATVFGWNNDPNYAGSPPDTGLSRLSPGVVAIGNGSTGDASGSINATQGIFGAVSCASLTTQTIISTGDLFLKPEATVSRVVIGAGGWAYSNVPSGQGSLTLINGSTDSPNITFYYGNNQNFSIDTAFGPPAGIFEPCSGQALRFIRQADEAGGAVVACMDLAGNFAIKGAMGADGGVSVAGAALTAGPSKVQLTYAGTAYLDTYGPDPATPGALVVRCVGSDGVLGPVAADFSGTGTVLLGGKLRILDRTLGMPNGSAVISADSGNLVLDSAASGSLFMNYEQGTQGVHFCDGALNTVASVDVAGLGTFNNGVDALQGVQIQGTRAPIGEGMLCLGTQGSSAYIDMYGTGEVTGDFTFRCCTGTTQINVIEFVGSAIGINYNLGVQGNIVVGGDFSCTGTKVFAVPHPLDSEKMLVHACLEGPENGVFYRGETVTTEGYAEITLPAYFEALTYTDDRSVLLTQLYREGSTFAAVAASRIKEGKFRIYSSEPSVVVAWEVKAVRRIGVDGKLAVEIEKRKPLKEAA